MTTIPRNDRERAEGEAADWLVRLSERPDDGGLRAQFEAWRVSSPVHVEIWARTARAYDLIGRTTPRHRQDWRIDVPVRSPKRIAGAVMAAAIAACLVMAMAPGLLLRLEADHVTGTAQVAVAALPDGSTVRLAPRSAIRVDFADGGRQVRLLKGSAFFQVTHDAAHPFRVVAADATVTVLGTAFEVRRDGGGAAIAVLRGHVRVDDAAAAPAESEHLLAGDWLHVRAGTAAQRGTMPLDEVAAWRGGRLVTRGRAVADVIEALRPFYPGLILVRDDAFARLRVSGVYDLRDPVTTLRDLAASHGAAVHRITPWLLVITAT